MRFDVFFSICQTPVNARTPSESEMFRNFFSQVEAADALGYETAWVAESHFSSEVQKTHREPVIPHWKGEVGLNTDIFQLAHHVFRRTKRIEAGSAVMNIVCNGGPIAAAEKVAAFSALHGLDTAEKRRLHVGFSAGRFDFMNRISGVVARSAWEEAAWPIVKGKVFREAAIIFLRLLRGDTLSSADLPRQTLTRADFRTEEHWQKTLALAGDVAQLSAGSGAPGPCIPLPSRWIFEAVKIIPQDWRRELVVPVIGSHDPALQEEVNAILPVQVFNLSITRPDVIDDTHRRLSDAFHPAGGPWKRSYMPRTVFVFLNDDPRLSAGEQSRKAREEARAALAEYWKALEGTLDPRKIEEASDNALVGNASEIADQILARYHPDDRLMLWFDFFNHDNARVVSDMQAFMQKTAPKVWEKAGRR